MQGIIDTDASNVGVGAVLSQEGDDGEYAIVYFSQALKKAERNYCVTCQELLALRFGTSSLPTLPVWEEISAADRPCIHHLAVKLPKPRGSGGSVVGDSPRL